MAKAAGKSTKKKRRARPRRHDEGPIADNLPRGETSENLPPLVGPYDPPPAAADAIRRLLRPPSPEQVKAAKEMRARIDDAIGIESGLRPPPWMRTASGATRRVESKTWITCEAKRLKARDEVPAGISITDFARKLAERMRAAAETDHSIRPVGWKHIKNNLQRWGLWPISAIR
jgi:hypothetical protein